MENLIAFMKKLGWTECEEGILHPNPNVDQIFANWEHAIESCIEIASE
jgi:hypothetical protein